MKKLIPTLAAVLMLGTGAAVAQSSAPMMSSDLMATVPAGSKTVTEWYKQNVYDMQDDKIGEVSDVLVDSSGRVTTLILSVGGFLGINEKDVAVSPTAVKMTQKNGAPYLVMNTTKDALKTAMGYKYDKTAMTWMIDKT